MPRNGSGVFSLPAGSTVTNGETSDASDINTPLQDIETDMNTPRPVVAGGTGASSEASARSNLGIPSTVLSKSADYTALMSDRSKLIVATSNITLSLSPAATLTDGWFVYVLGFGGSITIDPDGSEAVNGASTLTIADGESATLFCDGTNFYAAKTYEDTLTGFDPTKIAETDASSATEVDFDVSSTAYTHFRIVVSNLTVGTAGASLRLRTSTNGGSSFDSGASDYRNARLSAAGSNVSGAGSSDSEFFCTVGLLGGGNNNRAEIIVMNPGDAVNTGLACTFSGVNSSSFFVAGTIGGERNDTTAVDTIRLFPSTGNFSGKFTLYGMG